MSGLGSRTTETPNEPVFIDGIGPPLQQIEDDYRAGPELANERRDVLALIAEVYRLRARRVRAEEALRHYWRIYKDAKLEGEPATVQSHIASVLIRADGENKPA